MPVARVDRDYFSAVVRTTDQTTPVVGRVLAIKDCNGIRVRFVGQINGNWYKTPFVCIHEDPEIGRPGQWNDVERGIIALLVKMVQDDTAEPAAGLNG